MSARPVGNDEEKKMATTIAKAGPASWGPFLDGALGLVGVDVSGVAVLGVVDAVEFAKMAASGELGDRWSSSTKKNQDGEEN